MSTSRKCRFGGWLLILGISSSVQLVRCQGEYTGQGGTSLATGWQDPSTYSYASQQQVATAAPRQDIAGILAPVLPAVFLGAAGLVGVTIMQGQINDVRDKQKADEATINDLKNQIAALNTQVANAGGTTTALLAQQRSITQNCQKVNEVVGVTALTTTTFPPGGINALVVTALQNLEAKVNEILGVTPLTC